MGLESATYISGLVETNPVGASDDVKQGDDHLRLIKSVLKASLPNLDHAVYLERPQADVASGATTNIGAATTNFVRVTGVTTITAFDNVAAGIWRFVRFAGVLTLTYNATNLILPTAANITTAADDCMIAMSLGSGNWIVLAYSKATGGPLVIPDASITAAKLATGSVTAIKLDGSVMGVPMINGELVASVAANALTVAVKTLAGTDPSATDPVHFIFRSPTATSGAYILRTVTAALSVVISSGSTLGFSNATPGRLWITAHDNGGTILLGASNRLGSSGVQPFPGGGLASTTAEGGAGAADSSQVIYTSSGLASKPFMVLGYCEWTTGLTTAGTWNVAPDIVQLKSYDIPLPGIVIATSRANYTASTGLPTNIPSDDTIPQNTEGDQVISLAVTLTSVVNVLDVSFSSMIDDNTSVNNISVALFRDAVANALAATSVRSATAGDPLTIAFDTYVIPLATSITLKVRGGSNSGTARMNASSAVRVFGGVAAAVLTVREIMG